MFHRFLYVYQRVTVDEWLLRLFLGCAPYDYHIKKGPLPWHGALNEYEYHWLS